MKKTILFLLLFNILQAQHQDMIDENKSPIEQAKDFYQEKEYTTVIKTLENSLPQLDRADKIAAHKYLGFSYAKINDRVSAKEHFKILLKLNPNFTIDAKDMDSVIIKILNDAKKEIAQESAVCSCFIPGTGQLIKGEERKGKLIMLCTGLSVASSVLLWLETESKQRDYLSLGPDSVEYMDRYYNNYNKSFRISVFSSAISAGIYIYSILDALFGNTKVKITQDPGSFYLSPGNESIKVEYRIDF